MGIDATDVSRMLYFIVGIATTAGVDELSIASLNSWGDTHSQVVYFSVIIIIAINHLIWTMLLATQVGIEDISSFKYADIPKLFLFFYVIIVIFLWHGICYM